MCMLEVEMSQLLQEIEALRQPMKELNDSFSIIQSSGTKSSKPMSC